MLIEHICNGLHTVNADITAKKTLAKIRMRKYNKIMKGITKNRAAAKAVRTVQLRFELNSKVPRSRDLVVSRGGSKKRDSFKT